MNVNMFNTNKFMKNRKALRNMYLEKLIKEKQINKMIEYTNQLLIETQYKLENNTTETITDEKNLTTQIISDEKISDEKNLTTQIISDEKISEQKISDEIISDEIISDEIISDEIISEQKISDEIISEQKISDEIISEQKKEPDIYTYKNNVLEWSTDYQKEPDKYMARLIEIINKILNNDIDNFTYRDLIKDDSKITPSEDIFLAIENSKIHHIPVESNISDIMYNVKIPLSILENKNDQIIKSNDRVVELENDNNSNISDTDSNSIDSNKTEDKKDKKISFNFNKINKINNGSQNDKNIITKDTLIDKLNSLVKKVNDKVETEISKDVFMISQSITEKSSENIVNIICSMILDKIEKVIG